MDKTFRMVSIKDRMPDFKKRILFTDESYESGFKSEYIPSQKIEKKKGKFIELKDCPEAIAIIKNSFTHWLEEIK
tara:strand:+ start:62 stop:286 length:225 start_codon:yes stop_codon:yes gene_type:complete